MSNIVLPLLLCLGAVGLAIGCRCGIIGEKDKFLRADYAIIAKVLDNGTIRNNERVYRISVIVRIKPRSYDWSVIRKKVFTATEPSACGALLDKGSVYLLAGDHVDAGKRRKKRYLGLCKIVRKLSKSKLEE